MPDPTVITDKTEFKAAMGITGTDRDAQIDALLPGISEAVENFTGRQIVPARNITEVLNGRGSPYCFVSRTPIIQVLELKLIDPSSGDVVETFGLPGADPADAVLGGSSKWTTGDWIELINGGGAGGLIGSRYGFRFPVGNKNVHVKYDSGYATIPTVIKMAVWTALKLYVYNAPNGMESERIGNYSYKRQAAGADGGMKAGLPAESIAMLRPYELKLRVRRSGRPGHDIQERHLRTV